MRAGGHDYVTVLEVPPINSALDAVCAAEVAEHQETRGDG